MMSAIAAIVVSLLSPNGYLPVRGANAGFASLAFSLRQAASGEAVGAAGRFPVHSVERYGAIVQTYFKGDVTQSWLDGWHVWAATAVYHFVKIGG